MTRLCFTFSICNVVLGLICVRVNRLRSRLHSVDKRGLEECCRQISRTGYFGWECMRSDDEHPQMGEALVLKDLVCNQPLWLLSELGYKVPGGKTNQHPLQLDLRQSSYALVFYLEWRTYLDENWN